MKRLIIAAITLAALSTIGANAAKPTISLRGVEYTVDTLAHVYIGPGTTHTSLLLEHGNKHLQVYYSTTDINQPNVTLKAVNGKDKMAECETVSGMAERKTAPGNRYFLGINGDFWVTTGRTKRGESMVGTPRSTSMAEGIIYKAVSTDDEYQFTYNQDKNLWMGKVIFGGTVTDSNGATARVGGINTAAYGGVITVYNSTYFKGTDQNPPCAEVSIRYADGETFDFGKDCRFIVTSDPSTEGDMTVPADGMVLHGRGTTKAFIEGLHNGDEITMSITATLNDEQIEPSEIISGRPWIVQNGAVVPTGDTDLQPRSAMGYTTDDKVIFMVVDGRSMESDGISFDALGDLMVYAGCYMAVNVDGGGSSTLYSSALGVLNSPSIGSERYDSNGIFAVCSSPDDDEVSDIHFLDWAKKVPKYSVYTPKFYGYNQYGMLVETDVKGVVISCDESLGHIRNDSIFYADGHGDGVLTATYKGKSVTIPISVVGGEENIKFLREQIINDGLHEYTVEVQSVVEDSALPMDPATLTWESSDETVVTIDRETGTLKGLKDGEAFVIGRLTGPVDTLKVIVQIPRERVMHLHPTPNMSTWKITQSGGKLIEINPLEYGFEYIYKGTSSRNPKISIIKEGLVWSMPDTLRLVINPGEAPFRSVVFGTRANGSNIVYTTIIPKTVVPNTDIVVDLPLSKWGYEEYFNNFPVTWHSFQLFLDASTVGQEYTITVKDIAAVYDLMPADIHPLKGDVTGNGKVGIQDVTSLITYILGDTPDDFILENANMNGDGYVDILDVTALINYILE